MAPEQSDVALVTLRLYPFLHEALIAREMLEAEGIFAFVPDEHTISMDWLYRNAIGGIRLQVRSDDVARANDVLGSEAVAIDAAPTEQTSDERAERCSQCGGTQFEADRRMAAATWLILGLPLWWPRRRKRCKTCGHRASEPRASEPQ